MRFDQLDSTHVVFGDVIDGDRTDQPGNGTDPVGHAHQYTRVPRGYVEVVDIKPADSKPGESDSESEGKGRRERCLGVGDNEEEDGFHAESAAVEELSDWSRRQDSFLPDIVRQQTSQRHYRRHEEMRKRSDESGL